MDTHEHLPPMPTAEDYYRGVMPDGSRPPLLSKRLYKLYQQAPGAPDNLRDSIDEIARHSEYQQLGDFDEVRDLLREVMAAGREELKRQRESAAKPETPGDSAAQCGERREESGVKAEAPKDACDSALRSPRPALNRVAPATRAVNLIAMAMRAAKLLVEISAARTAFVRELARRAHERDKRRAFVEDRAVAVVKQTLLALDEHFEEIGFGSWMPFRFPDQWLMFCGLMTRVLAANGLIHAKHAATYRKLMEETPPVEKGSGSAQSAVPDPFSKSKSGDSPAQSDRPPRSWSRHKPLREVQSLAEMLEKLKKPP